MNANAALSYSGFRADQSAYVAALDQAHARAFHSYFTQYILTDDEAGYVAIDEGDYGALAPRLYDRIVETVPSKLCDED